jgi:hypothetical protein
MKGNVCLMALAPVLSGSRGRCMRCRHLSILFKKSLLLMLRQNKLDRLTLSSYFHSILGSKDGAFPSRVPHISTLQDLSTKIVLSLKY